MGLLKGIDPLLSADLLHVLRSMGHGDKLCVCDCNFPAATYATQTTTGKHLLLSVDLPKALSTICSVLPLDYFEEIQVHHMAPQEGVEMPPSGVEVTDELKASIREHSGDACISAMERFAFYDEARTCFAVVQTTERRPYGNAILVKGCIGPDGNDLKPSS
jgi:L-fucose mutarotase